MKIPSYSITIQTYVHRFEPYFKPLLARVHKQRPNVEKVVFVNGQHKEKFDENYRREMLQYASYFSNTFLLMSPIVRGCAFMWNNSINYTSGEYVLVLSDDVIVLDGFFDDFENMLAHNHQLGDESFRINTHWGHFCMYRKDLIDVEKIGFFDERLVGFGEEDYDWMWRYQNLHNKHMRNYGTNKMPYNTDDACLPGKNTRTHSNSKYSAFNREFMESKMEPDPTGTNDGCGISRGFAQKTIPGMETPNFYPGETWYRSNIQKL
jgi:hypothetical protein